MSERVSERVSELVGGEMAASAWEVRGWRRGGGENGGMGGSRPGVGGGARSGPHLLEQSLPCERVGLELERECFHVGRDASGRREVLGGYG